MGLILREDSLRPLLEAGGIITFANSVVSLQDANRIKGQQFVINSLTTAVPAGTRAQLYFVYVIQTGGIPSLVTSLNPNSVGPVGSLSWKLVGALYLDDFSLFGSFVNIDGRPDTDWMDWDLRMLRGDNLALSGNFNPAATRRFKFRRLGRDMAVIAEYFGSNAGAVNVSAGQNVLFRNPGDDKLSISPDASEGTTQLGHGVMTCQNTDPVAWTGNAAILNSGGSGIHHWWATALSATAVTSGVNPNVNLTEPSFRPASSATFRL